MTSNLLSMALMYDSVLTAGFGVFAGVQDVDCYLAVMYFICLILAHVR